MDQHIASAVSVEVGGIAFEKCMAGVAVILPFERRITNRTVGRRVAPHPAVYDRTIYAGILGVAAFEQSNVLIVVPIGGLGALIVIRAIAAARWDRCRRIDEVSPLEVER